MDFFGRRTRSPAPKLEPEMISTVCAQPRSRLVLLRAKIEPDPKQRKIIVLAPAQEVTAARHAPSPADQAEHSPAGARAAVERVLARVAATTIFALCAANIFLLRWENVDHYWYRPLLNAYSIGVATFILSRFVIALFYRAPRDRGLEPTVSIAVTAFNEEDAIRRTVAACYETDYPRAKLEVIVVDDGSTDRTLAELRRAQEQWPGLVVESFSRNCGKREAMAAGARRAHGEILIYVDSDSFLRRDAVRKIVQGFANPAVAAVSGHTDVANVRTNMLTRMQNVRYTVAFRIMKAAESVFGAVTCCPGCFSAYRRSCVLEILEPWLQQRFLGVPATFGDDRSLTNFLLRKYKVIYSSEAVATTIVPDGHQKFLKQQLRWKKSWLRECLIAATFMWKKHPLAAIAFYAQLVFPLIAPIILLRAFLWLPIMSGDFISMTIYSVGVLMIGMVFSSYYLFWRSEGSWIYGAYFTVYYMFVLIWQMPYAIATSRDTRGATGCGGRGGRRSTAPPTFAADHSSTEPLLVGARLCEPGAGLLGTGTFLAFDGPRRRSELRRNRRISRAAVRQGECHRSRGDLRVDVSGGDRRVAGGRV